MLVAVLVIVTFTVATHLSLALDGTPDAVIVSYLDYMPEIVQLSP